jgi:hypothetical protein
MKEKSTAAGAAGAERWESTSQRNHRMEAYLAALPSLHVILPVK